MSGGALRRRVEVAEALAVFGRVALLLRTADWPRALPAGAAAALLDAEGRTLVAGVLAQAHQPRDPALLAVEFAPDAPLTPDALRAVAAVELSG